MEEEIPRKYSITQKRALFFRFVEFNDPHFNDELKAKVHTQTNTEIQIATLRHRGLKTPVIFLQVSKPYFWYCCSTDGWRNDKLLPTTCEKMISVWLVGGVLHPNQPLFRNAKMYTFCNRNNVTCENWVFSVRYCFQGWIIKDCSFAAICLFSSTPVITFFGSYIGC